MIFWGTRHFGKVQEVAGQAIYTRFFHIFWLPLIPLGSAFIVSNDEEGVAAFPVRLNLISILAAYLRSYLLVATVIIVINFFIEDYDGYDFNLLVIAGTTLAGWIGSLFIGRTNSNEKYERLLLGIPTGIFAPPNWLPLVTVKKINRDMETAWQEEMEEENAPFWQDLLVERPTFVEESPFFLLYSLARYHALLDRSPEADAMLINALRASLELIPLSDPIDFVEESDFDDDHDD